MLKRLRRRFRRHDNLVLESVPLHTEDPKHAAQAPAQVVAAMLRGAHVIGLTETRGASMAEVKRQVAVAGYQWFGNPLDAHRNTTLLVRGDLKVIDSGALAVANNYRTWVTFEFHGSEVTVFEMHFETHDTPRQAQTADLVTAMTQASAGRRLAFYMGDSNPSKPQHEPGSEPSTTLAAHKMPTIWQELHTFPAGLGVNVVGRNLTDGRVTPVSAEVHDALGSDHVPATATYRVRRP